MISAGHFRENYGILMIFGLFESFSSGIRMFEFCFSVCYSCDATRGQVLSLCEFLCAVVVCSTSSPGGNQVDGLPPASSLLVKRVIAGRGAASLNFLVIRQICWPGLSSRGVARHP